MQPDAISQARLCGLRTRVSKCPSCRSGAAAIASRRLDFVRAVRGARFRNRRPSFVVLSHLCARETFSGPSGITMPNPNSLLVWEAIEHGAPLLLSGYPPRRNLGRLGDLSSDLGLPVGTLDPIISSPFVWIGAGLLIAYAFFSTPQVVVKRKKRSSGRVSGLNTAVLATGALAGGYLIGKYSGL